METKNISLLSQKMLSIIEEYSNKVSQEIFIDGDQNICFKIRFKGGFEYITIEGKVQKNETIEEIESKLRDSLEEMKKK